MDFSSITFPKLLFVTGIDTDAGKTYATGWLAREMAAAGLSVITQKFVQTGCIGRSEDIEAHRKIMGIEMQPLDLDLTTAPQIFSYPASADLAARIDGRRFSPETVEKATLRLSEAYNHVIIEGAGGVMVPLDGLYTTIDYIRDHNLPTILVTNGRLGSINHTLLSLTALKNAGVEVWAVVYNPYFDKDQTICADTRSYLKKWLSSEMPNTLVIEMPDHY